MKGTGSDYVVARLNAARAQKRLERMNAQNEKRAKMREANRKNYVKSHTYAPASGKPERVETARGINWAHFSSSRDSGTKALIRGHGFSQRFCEACDGVVLWHVRTGCVHSHRHG